MSNSFAHMPEEIHLLTQEHRLEILWDNGTRFQYPMEYLRVFCPCAECRGHVPSQRKLIDGKSHVRINRIMPVGHYAVKFHFNDDHDTGVYSWETLYELGENEQVNWQGYLVELEQTGKNREFCTLPGKSGCSSGSCQH